MEQAERFRELPVGERQCCEVWEDRLRSSRLKEAKMLLCKLDRLTPVMASDIRSGKFSPDVSERSGTARFRQ